MSWFKKLFLNIDFFIRNNEVLIRYILCGFLFLGILTQLSSFASILQIRADHRSIVATVDNDSAAGIETAERTNLLNDNQRRSYGPVWYRINYLMNLWTDSPMLDENRSDQQLKEKHIYFTLMLLSLISVYLLAGSLSFIFFDSIRYQLLSTLFLAPALLNEHFQSLLVFIAKPDHFLSLLVLISFASTALCLQNQFSDRYLKWTAFFWGVTLSTKLTALPFIPILFLLLYLNDKTQWKNQFKKLTKYLALSYFLIGFPQNFDFWRNIAYINNQNKQSSWATWLSFTEWLKVYYAQFIRPALLLALFIVIFPLRQKLSEFSQKKIFLKLLMFFLIPFGFMLSRKINEPFFRWYTLPFIAVGLLVFGGAISLLLFKIKGTKLEVWKQNFLNHPYSFLALFFILPWTLPVNTKSLSQVQKEYEVCRAEALKTESFIEEAVKKKEYILADPYAPFSPQYEGNWVDSAWEMKIDYIVPQKVKWIVLKNSYYNMYLTKEEGGTEAPVAHIDNMNKVREFYRLFWKKDQTVDPHNQTWKKVYGDTCGFEVWNLQY